MIHLVGQAIAAMAAYFDGDIRHINHSLKVYGYAKAIAESQGLEGESLLATELAAVFHDIGIPESMRIYGSSAGPYQEKTGVAVAKPLLEELGCPPSLLNQALFLIGHHHSFDTDGGLPLQTLFEADFIVNLEEGNLEHQSPAHIRERYFQTDAGKLLMDSLFPC